MDSRSKALSGAIRSAYIFMRIVPTILTHLDKIDWPSLDLAFRVDLQGEKGRGNKHSL
jgi:hypothetical protein